jgi:RNA polymerase sigma-70 factor (ECF subfamily)
VGLLRSDDEIIVLSRERPELFVEVFERHFDAICRYLTRHVGADLGADLAAEVFTTAFATRDRYTALTGSAEPWLYGIATNLLRRHRRRQGRHLAALARQARDDAWEAPLERSPSSRVASALLELAPEDRDVLLLVAWADLTYAQIAEALTCPVGTVRSRLHRARRTLRAALADVPELSVQEANHG